MWDDPITESPGGAGRGVAARGVRAMKLSTVFWNAAQLIDWDGCCGAIASAVPSGDDYGEAFSFFRYWFRPEDAKVFWWSWPLRGGMDQEARRRALLFAHYIALDEEGKT